MRCWLTGAVVGLVVTLAAWPALAAQGAAGHHLVFGSFAQLERAHEFAARVSRRVDAPIAVRQAQIADANQQPLASEGWHVVSSPLLDPDISRLGGQAKAAGYSVWRLPAALAPAAGGAAATVTIKPQSDSVANRREADPSHQLDIDLGVQNRVFAREGSNSADQLQYSASALIEYSKEFAGGRDIVALAGFGRWDSDDHRRTHADLRELSWTHVADRWELQAGVGQVFWGVVEFNHLIDVVNQTDLVENPDGEDKLGQPMVALTALRNWGTLELFALPGFRERTLPSLDGRLTLGLPIDTSQARYESGAEDRRVDGLARLSTQLGGVLFDLYHFNGTRRTPRFELASRDNASLGTPESVLIPVYDTVRQTALATQANYGDTALKLEALHQSGGPENYWAAAFGVEHTFVGLFGSSADLGAVVEYHYDSRGGAAFDTFFERDLALGARFLVNDLHDSQALLGFVWDTVSEESVLLLEASRRLNDRWSLELESRWFMGGKAVGRNADLADLLANNNKLGALQRDDYLQFEFIRYF